MSFNLLSGFYLQKLWKLTQMLSLQLVSLHSSLLSATKSPVLINPGWRYSGQFRDHGFSRERGSDCGALRAVDEKDSQSQSSDYEIDEDKAREALQQLDRQLQSLSQKQIPTPKVKASDFKFGRGQMAREEAPELSGSFLAYTAVALVVLSVFYNVLFYAVIKPSIDGPDYYPETPLVRSEAPPNTEAEPLGF